MREKKPDPNQPDLEKLNLTISVSLFMAVLAFFIVLNSYSSESALKSDTVKHSIFHTFRFAGTGMSTMPQGSVEGSGQVGKIEEVFGASMRSVLPDLGLRANKNTGAVIMSVSMPMLEEHWPQVRTRLTELLTKHPQAAQSELEIISQSGFENAAKIAFMAQELVRDGVSMKALKIGYESKKDDVVEFRFIVRKK